MSINVLLYTGQMNNFKGTFKFLFNGFVCYEIGSYSVNIVKKREIYITFWI